MPRRSLDQGVKPFEFRTGVAGLPPLGGMFRAGDPATIPPHKFHLLVNMRRNPGGMVTRPGLELVFDTEIQECIDGLTEDSGLQGGSLLLYPGAPASSQPATFRAVSPGVMKYSEYAIVLYGPAATVRGDDSPILVYPDTAAGPLSPTLLSGPFLFRGQIVHFARVDRDGSLVEALLGINLPQRSFLQASGCWRNEDGPVGDPLCPGPAGQPTPPATSDPPLWPFQHPIGSVGVLAYFDNPFGSGSGPWAIDSDDVVFYVATIPERADDALTGEPGVGEILYFVARQGNARKLVRWDGAAQATEAVAIPDSLPILLGSQVYGPILARAGADATAQDWGSHRTESGSWSVHGGYGWTLGVAPNYWMLNVFLQGPTNGPRLLEWGGRAHMIVQGLLDGPIPDAIADGWRIQLHPQQPNGEFSDIPSATLVDPLGTNPQSFVLDAVVSGHLCYAIYNYSGGPARYVAVGDFDQPTTHVPIALPPEFSFGQLDAFSDQWIAGVGGRVYIGGADASSVTPFHFVLDITEPANPFFVYFVLQSETAFDAPQFSSGAIGVPSDDHGGEGFQAS